MESKQKSPQQKKQLIRYAFAYALRIVLIALLCVGILISVANDLYAFVKPDRAVSLSWEGERTLEEAARQLRVSGVIQNPAVFARYVRGRGQSEAVERFSGELTLNASMSYREILLAFVEGTARSEE